ncbi:related to UPF0651 protein YPL107W, mitochondrial [Saccharomycodes ludwigii]|uniref:Related to UPF0651 protein YPL107W, mitochondrial n=1 Tax=Saccharomycodes ludwigii TaxID=36035 RepID=A0A376B7J0_9ASCO|nr:hypothetical protein SCDLUD_002064 [Saccharomycodes ludwigii]KAH3902247.1 hypothetical protein SCDLUD_002064 [Saccharomycodes ludwigii]SSD60666.1 related to UPF0651 protein YPL107W, mitochondrial [Saccharomycodes ludwigii]
MFILKSSLLKNTKLISIKSNTKISYRALYFRRCMTFEGNTGKIEQSPEERAAKIFGGGDNKYNAVRQDGGNTTTSRFISQSNKIACKIEGISIPAKPIEPDNCCMSGCVNCVWLMYQDDMQHWRHQRKLAAEAINRTNNIWPAKYDPPIKWLNEKNIPVELRHKKRELLLHEHAKKAFKFPPREDSIPAHVLALKRKKKVSEKKKEALKLKNENREGGQSVEKEHDNEDEDEDDGVPEFIKAFAKFERKKRLEKQGKL